MKTGLDHGPLACALASAVLVRPHASLHEHGHELVVGLRTASAIVVIVLRA